MTLVHATTRLWTVEEFHRLFDLGVLDPDERVELIEGEIVSMPAHNPPHVQGIITLNRLFAILHPGQSASPLCRPDLWFRVEDMLA